jgi:hypothetical protein
MPDATGPSTGSTTGVEGGASGGQTALTQAQLAAIAAAVSTAMSQMQAQLNSLTENVNKLANTASNTTSSDVDSETIARSTIDPAASQRRMDAYSEMAVADCIEFRKGCDALILRKISQDTDHHGAIPPIAPRSASGPGTTAS